MNSRDLWALAPNEDLTSGDLAECFRSAARPRRVFLDVNNTCNLDCLHCVFSVKKLRDPELTVEEYEPVIRGFLDLGTSAFCVSGKEPLISEKGIRVLQHLHHYRTLGEPFRFGTVTNGFFLERWVTRLAELELDYLDISVDGTEKAHDFLRGSGAFEKTMPGLKVALKRPLAETVFISSVLHARNIEEIPRMIQQLHDLGARHFYISPVLLFGQALGRPELKVTPAQLIQCYMQVRSTIERKSLEGVRVIFHGYPTYIPHLISAGLVSEESIREDQNGVLYVKEELADSAVLIELNLFPSAFWINAHITADGYYCGDSDVLTMQNYYNFTVGNVRESDIKTLFQRSLERSFYLDHLHRHLRESECRMKPCFRYCLGGSPFYSFMGLRKLGERDPLCWMEEEQPCG